MDDLISRQEALDALEWKWAGKAAIAAIKNLPSPKRKKGKWIDGSAYCVCNLCGHTEQQFDGVQPIPRHTPFCATCGAEMEETDG